MLLFPLAALAAGAFAFTPPGAGTNDHSSGFGFWQAGDGDEQPGSVGFEANANTPDSPLETQSPAQGEFDYRAQGTGEGFHADVVCIDAEGNEALIGLVVTQSTDADTPVGMQLEAQVVDNQDGNGGARGSGDTFDLEEGDADCDGEEEFDPDPIRGDIVVEDGGFATDGP